MKSWPFWIAGTLVLAVLFHISAILAYPHVVMGVLHERVTESEGANKMTAGPRASAEARGVVRPSPDLLYAICAYDLTSGPVKFSAPVPDTYWSLSMFAANTDNFFTVNDTQAARDEVEVILVTEDQIVPDPKGIPIVVAPSAKGVALVRTLISSEDKLPALQEAVKAARCASM
jgi:uncharacterized membrane protein